MAWDTYSTQPGNSCPNCEFEFEVTNTLTDYNPNCENDMYTWGAGDPFLQPNTFTYTLSLNSQYDYYNNYEYYEAEFTDGNDQLTIYQPDSFGMFSMDVTHWADFDGTTFTYSLTYTEYSYSYSYYQWPTIENRHRLEETATVTFP